MNECTYPLDAFPESIDKTAGARTEAPPIGAAMPTDDLQAFGAEYKIAPWALLNVLFGDDVAALHAYHKEIGHRLDEGAYHSRSEARSAALREFARRDVPTEVALGLLHDKRYGISVAVTSRSDADRYAPKEVRDAYTFVAAERAKEEHAVDPDLAEMNRKHAVVPVGGKTRVVSWEESPIYPGSYLPVFSTLDDFINLHMNRRKKIIIEGEVKRVPLGKWWVGHPQRRQYAGLAFRPDIDEEVVGGKLNRWTGFAVTPKEGDCSLYLALLRDVICNGNEEHYQYVIRWMALIVQKRIRTEICVALRSDEEGVGKGTVAKHLGRLFGPHFMQLTKPEHILGKFNPHLESLLVANADELFFAGDPRHRAALWPMITESTLTIEPKGVNAYAARNFLNLIISTNAEHALPLGPTARRFFVLDVPAGKMGDFDYFQAIEDQMAAGGHEALLYHLQHVDLTGYNVRRVPRTAALVEQQRLSRDGVDSLVESICHDGRIPCTSPDYPDVAITGEGKDGFDHHLRSELKLKPNAVKDALRKRWRCEHWRESRGQRRAGIQFPTLAELRELFAHRHGPQRWRAENTDYEAAGYVDPGLQAELTVGVGL